MRRNQIYPHRSVRSLPLNATRLVVALLCALTLTAATYWFRADLLNLHNQISATVLRLCAVPLNGVAQVEVFEPIGSAEVVTTPVFQFPQQPVRVWIMLATALLALGMAYRSVALARNFLVFLFVLLIAAAGVMFFAPSVEVTSAELSQIWLRGEVLVWLLLPWLSAGLLVILQHTVWPGLAWAVLMQAYGFLWSA
ncbi:MAG: hypothetical protein ABI995_17000, partial [Acidobacteriota bacterium]